MGFEPAEFNGPPLRRTRMSCELEEVNAKLPLLFQVALAFQRRYPMARYIGMDVHKRQIVICIVDRKGKVLKRTVTWVLNEGAKDRKRYVEE